MAQISSIKTIHLVIPTNHLNAFIDWQCKLHIAIATFPGFISLEIINQSPEENRWLITERFDSQEHANAWNHSTVRKDLTQEVKYLTQNKTIKEESVGISNFKEGITEVFVTEIDPTCEKEFKSWAAKIHQKEAGFPGFRGVYVQSPNTKNGRHWITILKFDTTENLDRWFASSERQQLLDESKNLLTSLESHRVISPYAGWFANTSKDGSLPPVWKQAMLILLILYPIVMLEIKYFNPMVSHLNNSLAIFLGNILSVALISWPFMPIAIKALDWFLIPPHKKYLHYTILGTFVVLFLYLIELLFFWNFY